MVIDHLNFTAFFDETGSITNDTPEIFGGSLLIIEDTNIEECRKFIKTHYPKGIHCNKLRKDTLLKASEDIGTFLKDKNCCAVTNIQTNKNLMKDYKQLIESQYLYFPTPEVLSLLKRYYNYSFIPRKSLFGVFNLIKNSNPKKVTIKNFMENIIRNKKIDRWDLYEEALKRSLINYKTIEPFKSFLERNGKIPEIQVIEPQSKTKNEEIMFSFPDLFAYSIRRVITHKEYELYNNLKHVFDKSIRGYCSEPELLTEHPNGIFIQHLEAKELSRLHNLTEKEWHEELNNWQGNS